MTDQPAYGRSHNADPTGDPVILALDQYRHAIRAAVTPATAAAVRARAERRITRNRTVSGTAAALAALAITVGGVALSSNDGPPNPGGPSASTGASSDPRTLAPSTADPTSHTPAESNTPTASGTASSPPQCRSASLLPRLGQPTLAGDQATDSLELINIGPTCTLSGHVNVQLRAFDGQPFPTTEYRQPGTTTIITLATRESATAQLTWSWSNGSVAACQAPAEITLTLPGDSTQTSAPWVAGPASSVCRGDLHVYPLHR